MFDSESRHGFAVFLLVQRLTRSFLVGYVRFRHSDMLPKNDLHSSGGVSMSLALYLQAAY